MSTKSALTICLTLSVLFLFSSGIYAEELKPVQLPTPQMEGGRPLMEVLKDRHSTREFSGEKLSPQELSNLLWAAFGINRPDLGKRTAPSARGYYEIEVYVALADGLGQFRLPRRGREMGRLDRNRAVRRGEGKDARTRARRLTSP